MSDIEQRLREAHPNSQQYAAGSMIFLEAAEEIASLKQQLQRQASAAKMGMDAAKKSGAAMYRHGQQMLKESNPEALDSERAMNAQLTGELEQARQIITDLVEYAEQNDPGCPHIGRAKGFLSGDKS